jgi:hypothetical protein
MAAGLGFKDFVTGEVLTAADVDGYLMQGIWVFASAAARDAAVTSPQEGNACYLKDTNQVLTYSGSAWVAVGGGSPLTTKGDIYGFSTVDARIPIGANDTVLTADSTQALGLKWATPASGGMTLIAETVASANSSISFSSIAGTYKQLLLIYSGIYHSATGSTFGLRLNNDSTSTVYRGYGNGIVGNTTSQASGQQNSAIYTEVSGTTIYSFGQDVNYSTADLNVQVNGQILIDNYSSSTKLKYINANYGYYFNSVAKYVGGTFTGAYNATTAITSLDIVRLTGTATISNSTNTSIRLYGLS